MKSAKVNAKGFTTWLWLSTYGKSKCDLPKNFCDFFWSSVLSYIIAIFAWPGHLVNIKDTSRTKAWAWIFHIPVAYIMATAMFEEKDISFNFVFYLWGLLVTVIAIVAIIITVVIVMALIELKDWIREKINERYREKERQLREQGLFSEEADSNESRQLGIITWWKAFKGKYCPKIEWQNLEKEEPRDRGFDFVGEPIEDDYDEAYNHN